MAITFPSTPTGATLSAVGGNNIVIAKPANTAENDWLFAMIVVNSASPTITAPDGTWVEVVSIASTKIYRHKATASEPSSYTFTGSGTVAKFGTMVRVVGAHETTPVDVASLAAGAAGTAIPSMTVTDGFTILSFAQVFAGGTWTPPGTMTEFSDQLYATQNFAGGHAQETVAAGATGTRLWVSSASGNRAVGMVALRLPEQTITPTGIASTAAVGAPTLTVSQSVEPAGIASTTAFGAPALGSEVAPGGIAPTASFGTAALEQQVSPSGIAPTEAFGVPVLGHDVNPSGIAPTGMFGTPEIFETTPVSPTGIAPTVDFGAPRLDLFIAPTGTAPTVTLGTPTISSPINPSGIASTEAVGTPSVAPTINPGGIAPSAAFGTPTIARQIVVDGIPSTVAVGVPSLQAEVEAPHCTSAEVIDMFASASIIPDESRAELI